MVLLVRVSSDWEKGGWDWEGWVKEGLVWEGWKAVVEELGDGAEDRWEEGEGERRERRLGSLDLEALISRSTLCNAGG